MKTAVPSFVCDLNFELAKEGRSRDYFAAIFLSQQCSVGSLAEEYVNILKKQILSVVFLSTSSGFKMSLIVNTVQYYKKSVKKNTIFINENDVYEVCY